LHTMLESSPTVPIGIVLSNSHFRATKKVISATFESCQRAEELLRKKRYYIEGISNPLGFLLFHSRLIHSLFCFNAPVQSRLETRDSRASELGWKIVRRECGEVRNRWPFRAFFYPPNILVPFHEGSARHGADFTHLIAQSNCWAQIQS